MSGILSGEEGAKRFLEYIASDTTSTTAEKKSIFAALRDMLDQVVEHLKGLLQNATRGSRQGRELAAQAENTKAVQALVDEYLQGLEEARQNVEAGPAVQAAKKEKAPADGRGVKYSILEKQGGGYFVQVDEDVLKGVPKDEWVDTVKEELENRYPDGVKWKGWTIKVDRQGIKEFLHSKYTQRIKGQKAADKLRLASNIDAIVEIADGIKNEDPKHVRKDDIKSFNRAYVTIRVGNRSYTAEVVTGIKASNEEIFYDIVKMTRTKVREARHKTLNGNADSADGDVTSLAHNMSQAEGNVKHSFAVEDSARENSDYSREEAKKSAYGIDWKHAYDRWSGKSPMSRAGYAMFVESFDGNGYDVGRGSMNGDTLYLYYGKNATDINTLKGKIAKSWDALREMPEDAPTGLESLLDEYSGQEIAEGFDPHDIVDTAGNWDDEDLVGWLWENVLEPEGVTAVKTYNGALVFDESLIEKRTDITRDRWEADGAENAARYSKKSIEQYRKPAPGAADVAAVERENRELARRNTKLEEQVRALKAEFKLSGGHVMDAAAVKKLAGQVLREVGSHYDQAALAAELTRNFEYLANDPDASFAGAMESMTTLARSILEQASTPADADTQQYFRDAKKAFRGTTLEVNRDSPEYRELCTMLGDGSWAGVRKAAFGRIDLKAVDANGRWDADLRQLREDYPSMFAGVSETDLTENVQAMLAAYDVDLESAGNPGAGSLDEQASWLAQRLYGRPCNPIISIAPTPPLPIYSNVILRLKK